MLVAKHSSSAKRSKPEMLSYGQCLAARRRRGPTRVLHMRCIRKIIFCQGHSFTLFDQNRFAFHPLPEDLFLSSQGAPGLVGCRMVWNTRRPTSAICPTSDTGRAWVPPSTAAALRLSGAGAHTQGNVMFTDLMTAFSPEATDREDRVASAKFSTIFPLLLATYP